MEHASERSLRLLVVDDDPDEAARIEELVKMAIPGPSEVYRLSWAGELRHGPVGRDGDCILFRLHGPQGRALAELTRLIEDHPKIAVVALVRPGEEGMGVQAVGHGAQDYLVTEELSTPLLGRTILTSMERSRHRQLDLPGPPFRDPLTGLPGPGLLMDRLDQALARLHRRETAVAVLCIDLDRFASVVQEHGAPIADSLLSSVGARLLKTFRAEDTVARYARDRFMAVCEDVLDEQAVVGIGERVAEALREPFTIGGREVSVSAAVGACMVQDPSDDRDELIRDAEAAMLRAKRRQREAPVAEDSHMLGPAVVPDGAVFLRAIEALEFRLFHQPIVNLSTGQLQGSEVLLRWEHPSRGLLSPEQFMAAAHAAGVLTKIGQWVLSEACLQAVAIQAASGPDRPLPVTVNLAPEQITSLDTVDRVMAALSAARLEPDLLAVEVTELALHEDPERAVRVVDGLRNLGVRLVLDDHGLAETSPEAIERFGVQLVKLDRAVIDGMGRDQEDPARARELIEQVHRFKIPVLAEAVETAEEAAALKDLGCDLAQGYFFGRPQPLEAFLTLVEGQAETGPDGDEAPAPAPAEEPAKAAAKPRPARRRRRAKRA